MNRKFIGIAAAVVVILLAVILVAAQASFVGGHTIARGVHVAGVDIGGSGLAGRKLEEWSHDRGRQDITFSVNGRTWTGKMVDVGVVPDTKAMKSSALAVGRTGNIVRRLFEQFGLSPQGKNLPPIYKIDRDKLSDVLSKIDKTVCEPAKDATIVFDDGTRSITPEVQGSTVDSAGSYARIESAVRQGIRLVNLAVTVKTPAVTAADLEKVDTVLSSYTTVYPAWKRERTHNISLAVASVDGELIKPGGEFSYNKIVGPRLKKFGFQDAQIYVQGKIIPGTGGGICQVSSTVYNAALLAGLKITERSHHSMKVPYVPLGRDATVAYGLLDLRFLNTTSGPIYVSAKMGRSRVVVNIYGSGADKKDYRIVTTKPKRIEKPNGKIVTAVTVYRVESENGVEVSRERVSSDRYNPAPPHTPTPPPARVASTGGQG